VPVPAYVPTESTVVVAFPRAQSSLAAIPSDRSLRTLSRGTEKEREREREKERETETERKKERERERNIDPEIHARRMDGLGADITSRRISHLREYIRVYV